MDAFTQLASNMKGFAHKFVLKSASASCVNCAWPHLDTIQTNTEIVVRWTQNPGHFVWLSMNFASWNSSAYKLREHVFRHGFRLLNYAFPGANCSNLFLLCLWEDFWNLSWDWLIRTKWESHNKQTSISAIIFLSVSWCASKQQRQKGELTQERWSYF